MAGCRGECLFLGISRVALFAKNLQIQRRELDRFRDRYQRPRAVRAESCGRIVENRIRTVVPLGGGAVAPGLTLAASAPMIDLRPDKPRAKTSTGS